MNVERLLGALEEFKKAQIDANNVNRLEHKEMMSEIKSLSQWRWKTEGAKLLAMAIVGAVAGFFGGRG